METCKSKWMKQNVILEIEREKEKESEIILIRVNLSEGIGRRVKKEQPKQSRF